MIAVRLYDLVLWLHITAVLVGFGALFAYPVFLAANARAPIGARANLHRLQIAFSKRVTGPAVAVILLAGVYLASKGHYWSKAWVSVPLVLLFVVAGLGATVLRKGEERLLALAEEDRAQDYDAAMQALARWTLLTGALVLVAVFFMVAKPFN